MAQASDVQSAVVFESDSALGLSHGGSDKLPSIAIVLTPADGNAGALDQRLRHATVPVVGRLDDGRVWLDLRTVLPRQDQRLVEMVVAATEEHRADGEEIPQMAAH
jgi:L-seryl-tRNA(Ser) seleniumtransferase